MTDDTPSGSIIAHRNLRREEHEIFGCEITYAQEPESVGAIDLSGLEPSGAEITGSATLTRENVIRMFGKLSEQSRPSYQHPALDIARLSKTIKRRWALRAFIHSLRGFGGWLQIYYPPAPLPRALVYKSNPTRRRAKSKRVHARRLKQARRK